MKPDTYRGQRPEFFDYDLPQELIAQHPVKDRSSSRMLVYRRDTGRIEHRHTADLPEYLQEGDVLVLNNTRVMNARLPLRRKGSGGAVEVFLLNPVEAGCWEALGRPLRRIAPGDVLCAGDQEVLRIRERSIETRDGTLVPDAKGDRLIVEAIADTMEDVMSRYGEVPLPPYIKRESQDPADAETYQTVYAEEPGAVAAPTAGLHLTEDLLDTLRGKGVAIAPVTLHVGYGTFQPLQAEHFDTGHLHWERYAVSPATQDLLTAAREEGRRVLCVGTTSVRTLETLLHQDPPCSRLSGKTDLFIAPGYTYQGVGGMLTNFHLPKSSLLALVSAFIGWETTKALYEEAIRERYRFYSYGDAMLLL